MRSYRGRWLWFGALFGTLFVFLELWDHLTDKRMAMPAEIGSHDKSRMVPSAGGAEVLGPEYESQADQPGGARQASA